MNPLPRLCVYSSTLQHARVVAGAAQTVAGEPLRVASRGLPCERTDCAAYLGTMAALLMLGFLLAVGVWQGRRRWKHEEKRRARLELIARLERVQRRARRQR
jgi:hypothetical protein